MPIITVIVPFYQRESGILRRALNSILSQTIPHGWSVEVIVVDDASPSPADEEVSGLEFREPLSLKLFHQKNGGPGAARNRGLDEMDRNTTLIAFLDSDDVWPTNHLARAIEAFNSGFDFYFTDNSREGHHKSCYHSAYLPKTLAYLSASGQKTGFLEIPKDCMVGLTLAEFPCQASTIVFSRRIDNSLRFNTTLKHSSEDVLFFTILVSQANRICFDLESLVECGTGVNIYFSSLGWDHERILPIKVDSLASHRLIAKILKLSPINKQLNNEQLAKFRREVAFHMLRKLIKKPNHSLQNIARLVYLDPGAAIVLPIDILRVIITSACERFFSSEKMKGLIL